MKKKKNCTTGRGEGERNRFASEDAEHNIFLINVYILSVIKKKKKKKIQIVLCLHKILFSNINIINLYYIIFFLPLGYS